MPRIPNWSVPLCAIAALLAHLSLTAGDHEWINRGGMWPPSFMAQQDGLLKDLGLEIPVSELSDPASNLLQAVVSLGGCSGSFVSKDGLVITNHHCVKPMLSYLTNTERKKHNDQSIDYVRHGFHAKALEQEMHVGPARRIFVTLSQRDVTNEMLKGVKEESDPVAKAKTLENNHKRLVADEEALNPNYKAEVSSFFRDESFILVTKLEIKDVRMVYAPPASIGNFGGDTDNWSWPRHTGDFAIIRAYIAPDGNSRDYHEDNVPFQPKNIIRVATSNKSYANDGDLVFVAGYPGSTDRLYTADEVRDDIERRTPNLIEKYGSLLALVETLSQSSDDKRTKLEATTSSLKNSLKNWTSSMNALASIDYLSEKFQEQAEFAQWIAQDEARQSEWGSALSDIKSLQEALLEGIAKRAFEYDLMYGYSAGLVRLVSSAIEIVRMAQERHKEDAERHPDYQERNWQRWLSSQDSSQASYDEDIARAVLRWVLIRAINSADEDIPEAIHLVLDVNEARKNENVIDQAIDALFAQTNIDNLEYRKELFKTANLEDLELSDDPVIKLALKLVPEFLESEDEDRKERGSYLEVTGKYIKALRAYKASCGERLCPDANSTLRIAFGHVGGYVSPSSGAWQPPFTNVEQVVGKHDYGSKEFEAPDDLRRMVALKQYAPYGDKTYGITPVNFLAALDTTGGNSGSAAFNTKGELIGLLFDGNKDALYSDWVFKEDGVRSILVDIRYVLWVIDKVANAHELLKELGVK